MAQDQRSDEGAPDTGEGTLGRIAHDIAGNPVLQNAIQGVMGASERISQAQEAALGALNLPTASDLDKLIRRVRSLSQRLESVEDGIDRLEQKLGPASPGDLYQRLEGFEKRLEELARELTSQPVEH